MKETWEFNAVFGSLFEDGIDGLSSADTELKFYAPDPKRPGQQ
jgi:hypothetical protein